MAASIFDLLGLGAGGLLTKEAYDRLGDIGDRAPGQAAAIGRQASQASQFQPFGVTTGFGGVQTDARGGFTTNLTPEQQAQQQLAAGGATSMFNQVLQGTGQREQSVFDRIRAMQMPAEERQRLATEERLLGQGRLGLRTAQFGGAPEQFADAQAQAEAQNQAALMAMQQAQAEQMQQGKLGQQFFQNQYVPEANLLNALGAGTQIAGIADVGRRQGANLMGEAGMAGLNAQLGAASGQASLMGQLGTGLMSNAMGSIGGVGGLDYDNLGTQVGSIWDSISGIFGR